ncbi:site-2 protease family protein [Candidatus Woesearchaeota archaeon]|nr:site-2 protease family protein [Candidatus Woesearchaeota archaeon]
MSFSQYVADHLSNILTIGFYVLVILLLVIYRKKFDFQGKIIAMRRTKFGVKFIDKYAAKHKETIKILGYVGIGVGFIGMVYIFIYILGAVVKLFTHPAGPAALSPVLPGVNIPGSPLFIPLWVLIPLFIVIVLHELGHGLVAKAHGLKIKSTGFVFFGPLAGAFVEPDEKKLQKANDVVQYSVFAAGPFANALTGAVVLAILALVLNPLTGLMVNQDGFSVSEVTPDFPAAIAGLEPSVTYDMVNGLPVETHEALIEALAVLEPGDAITIGNNTSSYVITTTTHPEDESKAYIGVMGIQTEFVTKENVPQWSFKIMMFLRQFFFWMFVLSLGLGAFNLLPLGPVDGGRMIQLVLLRTVGEKKGHKIWVKLALMLVVIILFLLFVPIIRAVIGA